MDDKAEPVLVWPDAAGSILPRVDGDGWPNQPLGRNISGPHVDPITGERTYTITVTLPHPPQWVGVIRNVSPP